MRDQSPAAVFRGAQDNLATARTGLSEMRESAYEGIETVITFGCGVLDTIQSLKDRVSGFDDWYAPWNERIEADNVFSTFRRLRNDALKGVTTAAEIDRRLEKVAGIGTPRELAESYLGTLDEMLRSFHLNFSDQL